MHNKTNNSKDLDNIPSKMFTKALATLLLLTLLVQQTVLVSASDTVVTQTNDFSVKEAYTSSKISSEVKLLARRYRENFQKDKLRVIIRTNSKDLNELKSKLLTVDEDYQKSNKTANRIAGEVSIYTLDEIAEREDVVRIALDPRNHEDNSPETEQEIIQAITETKTDLDIKSLVEQHKGGDNPQKIRVVIQTTEQPQDDLRERVRVLGNNFKLINGMVAEVSSNELKALAARDDVEFVSLDRLTRISSVGGEKEEVTGTWQVHETHPTLTGKGIGVAVLDTGVDPIRVSKTYSDIDGTWLESSTNRVIAKVNFVYGETTTNDLNGHGTMVAHLIAGLKHRRRGGIAPEANIINVRVLNAKGEGRISDVIKGLDWIVTNKSAYNIRVANLSLGASSTTSFINDPLCVAVRKAVAAGIVVVTSAGNFGKDSSGKIVYGTITSPGIEPMAITVGAAKTRLTDSRENDAVCNFSSRGPTRSYRYVNGTKVYDNIIKPDLVAPGNRLLATMPPNVFLRNSYPRIIKTTDGGQAELSGTSMAAPIVSGTVALLIQRNPSLTPALVRAILQWTAQSLPNTSIFAQGAGYLNILAAERLAAAMVTNSGSLSVGSNLLSTSFPSSTFTWAGYTFSCGKMVTFNGNHVYGGDEVIKKMQLPYKQGVLWYGNRLYNPSPFGTYTGTANQVLTPYVRLMNSAIKAKDNTLNVSISSGLTLDQGIVISEGLTVAQGVVISEGIVVAEGVVIAEGIVVAEGVIIESTASLIDGED